MCAVRENEEPLPYFTLDFELKLELSLQKMERLLIILHWQYERRCARYGAQDPVALEAAVQLRRFKRFIDRERCEQAHRLRQLV